MLDLNQVHLGDALELAEQLPSQSINCIVTSPPYYGLRDYGTATWHGGNAGCDHSPVRRNGTAGNTLQGGFTGNHEYEGFIGESCPKCGAIREDKQMGLEPTYQEHIANMVELFRELRRTLRDDGVLWLNYGDCYATSANGRSAKATKAAGGDDRTFRDKPFDTSKQLPAKNLMGMPWRLALALQDDGWFLRADVIWHKPNSMPSSVKDRPGIAHEYLFMLTKSPRYWYDADAIREPTGSEADPIEYVNGYGSNNGADSDRYGKGYAKRSKTYTHPAGRNKRSVWRVATEPFPGAHFATMPEKLIEPPILSSCPHKVCIECEMPWVRKTERSVNFESGSGKAGNQPNGKHAASVQSESGEYDIRMGPVVTVNTLGFEPQCDCNADHRPGVVLDPFFGSGTVGRVAIRHSRQWIGFELNPDYITISKERTNRIQVGFVI